MYLQSPPQFNRIHTAYFYIIIVPTIVCSTYHLQLVSICSLYNSYHILHYDYPTLPASLFIYIYIFIYLFVCVLFSSTVTSSDDTALILPATGL
jgi:hypothetical protein